MNTNGHITLWRNKRQIKYARRVPYVAPVTRVHVPLLAVFWANCSTIVKSRRTSGYVNTGQVVGRLYVRRKKRRSYVIRYVNQKIYRMFRTKYRAKWVFIATWDVTLAGATKYTPVQCFLLCIVLMCTYYTVNYTMIHFAYLLDVKLFSLQWAGGGSVVQM